MAAKNYTINFVDPSKSTINVVPAAITGPSGYSRQTDIDLIGMGHSLWGEVMLENLVHMLENFSSDEDIHTITAVTANSITFSGDVTLAFPTAGTFDIFSSDNNDGSYVVESSSYVGTPTDETTVVVGGSPALTIGGNLGYAGEIGVPNKASAFGASTPIQGQLWFNQTRGHLFISDIAGSPETAYWKRVGGITISDTQPTSAVAGDLWWETTVYAASSDEYGRNLQIYIGGSWIRVSSNFLPRDGSKVMQGTLDMGSPAIHQIKNLADPTDAANTLPGSITQPNDAVNVGWADSRYVNVTGDAMTGSLDMGNQTLSGPLDPTAGTHVGDRDYNDARYVNVTGDTMTGNLTINNGGIGRINFGGDGDDYISLNQADDTFRVYTNSLERVAIDAAYNVYVGGVAASSDVYVRRSTANVKLATEIDSVPIGTIFPWASPSGASTEPTGYFFCWGYTLLQASYPELYAVIGTTYGIGGAGTFKLPDLRDQFVRGWVSGRTVGDLQTDTVLDHTHTYLTANDYCGWPDGGWDTSCSKNRYWRYGTQLVASGSVSVGGGTETRPKNMALNWIIKYI